MDGTTHRAFDAGYITCVQVSHHTGIIIAVHGTVGVYFFLRQVLYRRRFAAACRLVVRCARARIEYDWRAHATRNELRRANIQKKKKKLLFRRCRRRVIENKHKNIE